MTGIRAVLDHAIDRAARPERAIGFLLGCGVGLLGFGWVIRRL